MSKKTRVRRERELAARREAQTLGPPSGQPNFQVRATSFSGPLPPPDVLARYDEIVPGSANRILMMAEANGAHRRALEAKVIEANCRAQGHGQVMAFILAMTVILAGSVLMYLGHEAKGFAMVVSAATSLIGAFLWGRWRQERERREKLSSLVVRPSSV